jgi:hypothetical protein
VGRKKGRTDEERDYGGKREDDKEGRLEDFTLELIGVRRATE